jgi:hypothetical protein
MGYDAVAICVVARRLGMVFVGGADVWVLDTVGGGSLAVAF